MESERLVRKSVVLDRLGCKNTKLYELIESGLFPKPVKLPTPTGKPGRVSYWPESMVAECIQAIAEQRLDDLRRIASQDLNAVVWNGGTR